MNKEVNYKKLYLEKYKNIPNYCFWGILIGIGTMALAGGLTFAGVEGFKRDYEIAATLGIIFGGLLFAVILAFIARFFVSISISQKIVVADSLLAMKDNNKAPVVEDELPEL